MQKDDFDPDANDMGWNPGTGTDVRANGEQGYVCLENKVHQMISTA
jgi:hypothetical protein